MIVTCQNCETSFQLDESRVPPQGIRVRCSRCKEAFFLAHPSASRTDAIHAAAAEAAAGAGAPSATRDLTAKKSPSKPAVAKPASKPASKASSAGASRGEDDEHDWEFNVEPPDRRGESARADAPPEIEQPSGIDLAAGETGAGLSLETGDDQGGAGEQSAFGSIDDYSSVLGGQDESHAPVDALGDGDIGLDLGDAPDGARSDAGRYSATAAGDDLGDPESWDFFGESPPASRPAPSTGSVLGRIALTSAPAAGGLGDFGAWDEDAFEEAEESMVAGTLHRVLGITGHAAGWVLTLALATIALVAGFRGTAESVVRSSQSIPVGRLEARDLQAHWVDTARGATLLVVRGELVNPTASPIRLGGRLELSFVDGRGRAIESDPRPLGLVLDPSSLRELAPDALRLAADRAVWQLAQETLAPDRPLRIEAIFEDVPAGATRFAIASDGRGASGGGRIEAESDVTSRTTVETPAVVEPGASEAETPAPSEPAIPTTPGTGPEATDMPAAVPDAPPPSPLPKELTWGD